MFSHFFFKYQSFNFNSIFRFNISPYLYSFFVSAFFSPSPSLQTNQYLLKTNLYTKNIFTFKHLFTFTFLFFLELVSFIISLSLFQRLQACNRTLILAIAKNSRNLSWVLVKISTCHKLNLFGSFKHIGTIRFDTCPGYTIKCSKVMSAKIILQLSMPESCHPQPQQAKSSWGKRMSSLRESRYIKYGVPDE